MWQPQEQSLHYMFLSFENDSNYVEHIQSIQTWNYKDFFKYKFWNKLKNINWGVKLCSVWKYFIQNEVVYWVDSVYVWIPQILSVKQEM